MAKAAQTAAGDDGAQSGAAPAHRIKPRHCYSRARRCCMIAVIFEFTPREGRFAEYMDLVGTLKADLERAEGFISIERFESITTPGKYVSLQFWRDEESVRKWRNLEKHRQAQAKGR